MELAIIISVLGISLMLIFLMRRGIFRLRAIIRPQLSERWLGELPGISVLKPVRGEDSGLKEALRSYFEQDYPLYEVLFGCEDAEDPAVAIVKELILEYPHVDAGLVIDRRVIGGNPKVNNLANIHQQAQYSILLIADSNVEASSESVSDMFAHLMQPGVGLVVSGWSASAGRTLGAKLEGLQLSTFVNGGMAGCNLVAGTPVVVGKSMMMREQDLERIGGWRALSRVLAEDQLAGQQIQRLGRRVAMSGCLLKHRTGDIGLGAYVSRHMRWTVLRKFMAPFAFAGEILLSTQLLAISAFMVFPSWPMALVAVAAFTAKAKMDASCERTMNGGRVVRHWSEYLWLTPLRELVNAGIWLVAWCKSRVRWSGRSYSIRWKTRIKGAQVPPAEAIFRHPVIFRALHGELPEREAADVSARLRAISQRARIVVAGQAAQRGRGAVDVAVPVKLAHAK